MPNNKTGLLYHALLDAIPPFIQLIGDRDGNTTEVDVNKGKRDTLAAQIAEAIEHIIGEREHEADILAGKFYDIPVARNDLRHEQRERLREFLESSNDPK